MLCVCVFFFKSHLNKGAFSVRTLVIICWCRGKAGFNFLETQRPIPRVLKWFRRGNSLRNLQVTICF